MDQRERDVYGQVSARCLGAEDIFVALSEYAGAELGLRNARIRLKAGHDSDQLLLEKAIASDEGYASSSVATLVLIPGAAHAFVGFDRLPTGNALDAVTAFANAAAPFVRNVQMRKALEGKTRELDAVYAIDAIRDREASFDEKLRAIMDYIFEQLPVALTILHAPALGHGLPFFGSDPSALERTFFEANQRELESMMAKPTKEDKVQRLEFKDREILIKRFAPMAEGRAEFLIVSQKGAGFSEEERNLFFGICSQFDTAIFENARQQKLENIFKRYVSDDVFQHILGSDDDLLRGSRREVTCFFSDLRGFTAVSERLPTEEVVGMLNEHFVKMCSIVFEARGTVDKLIGDCVMAFFGAPLDLKDHTLAAVRAACKMRAAHNVIAAGWQARGLPPVQVGIGLHLGEVFVGSIGGEQLSSYTIIGDHVNLASRLEGVSLGNDIIVSRDVVEKLGDFVEVEARGEVRVKGKSDAIEIFNVLDVR